MLECTLKQGMIIKKMVGAIVDLIETVNFDCTEEGIFMQAMDSSCVSLISLFLGRGGFVKYKIDHRCILGINIRCLQKILNCSEDKDSISFKSSDDNDTIRFIFESENKARVSTFDMRLMDIDSDYLSIPEMKHDCVVKMLSTEFRRICRNMSMLGDTVSITITKENMKFSVSGDTGKGDVTLKNSNTADQNSKGAVAMEIRKIVKKAFALRYLYFFTKATSLSETVKLCISSETPLMVEYKIENVGHIRYYLAPKIDDDE